jgi:hypothetical protein
MVVPGTSQKNFETIFGPKKGNLVPVKKKLFEFLGVFVP